MHVFIISLLNMNGSMRFKHRLCNNPSLHQSCYTKEYLCPSLHHGCYTKEYLCPSLHLICFSKECPCPLSHPSCFSRECFCPAGLPSPANMTTLARRNSSIHKIRDFALPKVRDSICY